MGPKESIAPGRGVATTGPGHSSWKPGAVGAVVGCQMSTVETSMFGSLESLDLHLSVKPWKILGSKLTMPENLAKNSLRNAGFGAKMVFFLDSRNGTPYWLQFGTWFRQLRRGFCLVTLILHLWYQSLG